MVTEVYTKTSFPVSIPHVHGNMEDFVHWFPVVTMAAWRDRLQLIITQAKQLQPTGIP